MPVPVILMTFSSRRAALKLSIHCFDPHQPAKLPKPPVPLGFFLGGSTSGSRQSMRRRRSRSDTNEFETSPSRKSFGPFTSAVKSPVRRAIMNHSGVRSMVVQPEVAMPGIFKSLNVRKGPNMPEGSNFATFCNLHLPTVKKYLRDQKATMTGEFCVVMHNVSAS